VREQPLQGDPLEARLLPLVQELSRKRVERKTGVGREDSGRAERLREAREVEERFRRDVFPFARMSAARSRSASPSAYMAGVSQARYSRGSSTRSSR